MRYSRHNPILQACRTLFGQQPVINLEFLATLQPRRARSAYRVQVKAHHPDRFDNAPQHVRQYQTERFREIYQAYGLLKSFLESRQTSDNPPAPARPAKTAKAAGQQTSGPRHHNRTADYERHPHIPDIPLEFGMFAYYSGKILYPQLVQALRWQRRQRPNLGDIAIQWGWLTNDQVRDILRHRDHSQRFGKRAVEMNFLRTSQVEALLAHQQSLQQQLGQIFVDRGLMSRSEVSRLAQKLEQHNAQLRSRTF